MQPKLIINFDSMSEADFLTKAMLIDDSLTGNANFPLPWPTTVPTPTDMHTQVLAYDAAYIAAKGGDSGKITLRINARATLTTSLKQIAPYLEVVAAGSVPLLQTTGYDLRQDSHAGSLPGIPDVPTNVTVTRSPMPGSLILRATSPPGAHSFQVATTTGDPTVEANWGAPQTFLHCSHIELNGLTSGSKTSLRLRGIGTSGPGPWADPVTIFVG